MVIYSKLISRQLFTVCMTVALILGVANVQAQDPTLEPIVTFDQSHPLVAESTDAPMVRVYAGGDVVVNRRPGMRNPGLYEFKLSDAEFAEIVELAQSSEIVNFSEPAVVAARNTSSELRAVSDPTTSIFEFNRLQGSSALAASASVALSSEVQSIRLDDVVETANATPSARSTQSVKALHVKMIELFSRAGN